MNTTIKNIFFRTLFCTIFSLACMGVKAQTTYTVYFDTTLDGGWGENGESGPDNGYFYLYIQVYSVDANGTPSEYYTFGYDGDGNPNWDTFTWTGSDYIYSWTYTGTEEIPEGAKCIIKDSWGNVSNTEERDFVNRATYTMTGTSSTGTWIFNPAKVTSSLPKIDSFTVTYSGGLSINDGAADKTITVTCNEADVDVSGVSVQGEIVDDYSMSFTFVNSDEEPVTFEDAGTYVITIPAGYFLLGDGETSDEITLTYTIVEYKYTIYFDNTNNWSSVYATVFNPNDWNESNYIYYAKGQQIYKDDTSGKYVLEFTTTTDLSGVTLYCYFTEEEGSQGTWLVFHDGATYSPTGIVVDGKYMFYFDWNCIGWGSSASAAVYYYDDDNNNEKVYLLGSETDGTVTWDDGIIVSDNIYAWAFDEDIPDDKTAYVEITVWGDDSKAWSAGSMNATEFKNVYIYSIKSDNNGVSYPYGVFNYDEYYGTGNPHTGTVSVSTLNVTHKDPKWSSEDDSSHDTFNKVVKRVDSYDGGLIDQLQAANTYVDTLYVLKGNTVQLTLPYTLGDGVAANVYHRWFDFRTDGNYRYGDYDDLLRPTGIETNSEWNCIYRFANGYVCGSSNADVMCSNATYAMNFNYPTDREFEEISSSDIVGTDGYIQQKDNDFYIVACDISPYTDCVWTDNGEGIGSYTEPTLAGRAIYYIVGIDPESTSSTAPEGLPDDLQNMWRLRDASYQGGTNEGNYLEEYEITYPARRTSNNTLEIVTLSKDASSYIVPGVGDSPETNLDATISGETNGFSLVTTLNLWSKDKGDYTEPALSGERRVLQFYNTGINNEYSDAASGAPWKVDDGTELTILVTKTVGETTYNIARYHLTFKENTTPLTQTQVAGLDSDDIKENEYWWKDMTYRSPKYMDRNYDKIASLTFDYDSLSDVKTFDPNADGGFHYFPMDWDNTSYAFYDGSTSVAGDGYDWYAPGTTILNPDDGSGENHLTPSRKIYTQWSMYSLVNVYIGYGDSNIITETDWNNTHQYPSGSDTWVPDTTYTYGNGLRPEDKPSGTDDYWLYIDASDRPGSVAVIDFEDPICVGTQVFGTALIKSASEPTSDDAAVLFSIVGVTEDETTGKETYTTLYSQCSSQIRMTTYLNMTDTSKKSNGTDVDEDNLNGTVTGKGDDTNEWFQLYFSFISKEQQDFKKYALKIDNYCSSTSGGDYYFDDIELYIVQPTFLVEQIAPVCTEDVTSAVRLMVDFDMLETRMGDTVSEKSEEDNDYDTVSFMIIDMTKYNNYFLENTDAKQDDADDIAKAISASTVQFVTGEGEDDVKNYMTLNFYTDDEYSGYPIYNGDERVAGKNTSDVSNGYFFLYTVDGVEYLAIDCYADISPYKAYKILLLPYDISEDDNEDENYAEKFADCIDGTCQIASDFYLTSSTILKVNGETVDPLVDYCAGQTVVIQPEVTYTADEEGNTTTLAGEYFDWFFGTEDEYTEVNDTYGVSLETALLRFRAHYSEATELSETDTPVTGENADTDFTEGMYNIIAYYLGQQIKIEGSYYAQLVLYKQYLEVVIPTSGLDLVVQPIKVVVLDETGDEIEEVCFGYVPLTLSVGGNAPSFNAGFHNVEYPGDDFVPNIRLGLSQVKQAWQEKNGSDTSTPIHVNLRNASYSEDGGTDVDHLGIYTTSDGTMDGLYLVGTNDPAFEEALSDEYFTQYDLPIGKVLELYAIEDDEDGESYMKIAFYDEYTLREGYSYIVLVNCEEKDVNNVPVDNGACQGTLPIELKIVPEYLVWTGDSTSNWNNDSHWSRVSSASINATKDENSQYFTDGTNANTNGFVPMLFTKVVIPADSMACLYPAGFALENGQYKWNENNDASGSVTESLRDSIMYDLMVYDYMKETTGVLELDSMKTERYRVNLCSQLHLSSGAQMLHSELLLVDTVWTEVKIPVGKWQLVSTPLNSVYSGDWYTKKATGTESAEYFKDIKWSDDDNDRYDPDIYQRSWDKDGTIVVSTTDSHTSSEDRTTLAYVSTGWTSAYNDASVEYSSGLGFSLEGWSSASTDNIMFRFPKADTEYTYSNGSLDENHGTGTLLISELVERTEEPKDDDVDVYTGKSISVTLPDNTLEDNNYYLVGNPFTAPMSMAQFMEGNTNVATYWTESEYGPIAGSDSGTSDGYDDYLLPPYTGFFITLTDNSSSSQISFTEDMQVLADADKFGPINFSLRATSSKGATSACVAYQEDASDGYSLGEDVPLLEDDSWMRDGMPMVYTVAGDMAVSINTLSNATVIPIGAFADDDCTYTLQFTGVNNLNEPTLYDAVELTETPITEGFTLDLVGASHGRYFIRTRGTALGFSEIENSIYDITAYSPTQGTIIVSSSLELENVEVYSVGGMLLNRVNAGGNISCTISGINSGVAIVRAKTSEGTFVKKIRVR